MLKSYSLSKACGLPGIKLAFRIERVSEFTRVLALGSEATIVLDLEEQGGPGAETHWSID